MIMHGLPYDGPVPALGCRDRGAISSQHRTGQALGGRGLPRHGVRHLGVVLVFPFPGVLLPVFAHPACAHLDRVPPGTL